MRRRCLLAALTLALACATAESPLRPETVAESPGASGSDSAGSALQWVTPHPGAVLKSRSGLLEVGGRVGWDWLFEADVVIAIDASRAALLASGLDVDGDERLGSTHRFARFGRTGVHAPPRWTSDPGDTIYRAQVAAARRLIAALDSPQTRIGVLRYGSEARPEVLLGSAASALEAIDSLPRPNDLSGVDVRRALRLAYRMLLEVPSAPGPEPPRVVLLLSSGEATLPGGSHWARETALEEARRLSERRVALCPFAFGEELLSGEREGPERLDFLGRLAATTGCAAFLVDELAALDFDRSPRLLSTRSVAIRNGSTGRTARAVRLLPSGAFDGFVELVPGANRIEVEAQLSDGRVLREVREVHYEPAERETRAERRATARMLLRLRRRGEELDATAPSPSEPEAPLPTGPSATD